MTIRIWQSYSCNNSSSFRLVARFGDHASAQAAATDLDGFFTAYAVEMDALLEANDYTWPGTWPPGALEFAKRHGFSLGSDAISWGDVGMIDDEPDVHVEDEVLVVYHSYCGGFGKGVPAYLAARGATEVEAQHQGDPIATVLFSYSGGDAVLDAELAKLFAQIDEDSRDVQPLAAPWTDRECYGTAAFYRDAKTVGMVIPTEPRDLPKLRAWLAEHGIANPSIRVCDYADEGMLAAIAGATCESCEAPLELWHPRLRDVETAQMACTSCGGLYEIATFVAAAEKRERARKRADARAAKEAQAQAAAKAASKANAKMLAKAKAKTNAKRSTKKR